MRLGIFKKKWIREHDQASFDLIDLSQFHSTACRYLTGYVVMYISILISLAVYASDIYTAIVLLAFDRWSTSIKPYVPFNISRWIFAGCIILSFVLLLYEYIVAYKVIRGRNVSLTYTNPLARNLYSIRGYDYFCLFAKITKSRNKVEYIALFVYFTFKGWARLIFADSPRQVLNALTLYSVLKIDSDFVDTVEELANRSFTEAAVVSVMAFSLLIWVINVTQFIIALLCACPLYVHIDKSECSGLEEYCCTRINKRIAKLVAKHHKKGLKELKEANKRLPKQPTLPLVDLDTENNASSESFDDIVPLNKKGGLAHTESREHLLSHSSSQTTLTRQDSESTLANNPLQNLPNRSYSNSQASTLHSKPSQNTLRSQPSNSSLNNPRSGPGGAGATPPANNLQRYPTGTGTSILRSNSNNMQSNNNVRFQDDNRMMKSPSQTVQVQEPSPEATVPPSSVTFGGNMSIPEPSKGYGGNEMSPIQEHPNTNPFNQQTTNPYIQQPQPPYMQQRQASDPYPQRQKQQPPPNAMNRQASNPYPQQQGFADPMSSQLQSSMPYRQSAQPPPRNRPKPPPIRTDLAQAQSRQRQTRPEVVAKPVPYRPAQPQPPVRPESTASSHYSPQSQMFDIGNRQQNVSELVTREPTLPNLRDSSVSMSTIARSNTPHNNVGWANQMNQSLMNQHQQQNHESDSYEMTTNSHRQSPGIEHRQPTLPKFDIDD
jgi:hypothetical protein